MQDLKDLSNALHARGMYLMVDVVSGCFGCGPSLTIVQVVNHVGSGDPARWRPSEYNGPFNSPAHYHPFCTPDWSKQEEVEQCKSAFLGMKVVLLSVFEFDCSGILFLG